MKKIVLLLAIILIGVCGYTQPPPQNWNWYFGYNCAINFSSGNPIALPNSAIHTEEGCATISDTAGNFLFYTDGVSVWNKNNVQMPNGFGLYGYTSTTQSALIVPKPDSSNIYFIFTADYQGQAHGINYSEVDITLNSGMGDVTVKNVQLITPACEKLVAIKHCNGLDYWVIAQGFNDSSIYSYLVSPSGVTLPIITNIGIHDYIGIGYLKASPNGKKIVSAVLYKDTIQLFDFDNSTGILSNNIHLPFGAYGVSFSPDNTKLYTLGGPLYQYDISSNNQSTIISSQYLVATYSNYGALQLGPNNKLYIAESWTHNIDVINFPNISGAGCNYQYNAVNFGTDECIFGLPNFIDANNVEPASIVLDTTICSTAFLTLNATSIGQNYLWSTGDTSNSISIDSSGTY